MSIDLIYGANGEAMASWKRTIEEAVSLQPEHLSCYALTIEPATSLGRQVAAGLVPAPDPDLQADMYDLACGVLRDAGYEHYEVSNWARPGYRSVHNMGYWKGRPYLGLGAGAHSYRDGARWWNVRPPQQYTAMLEPIWTGIQTAIQGTPVKDALDTAATDVDAILNPPPAP